MIHRLTLISIFILSIGISCNEKEIDEIISGIDTQDLSPIKGLTVYYRSEGHNSKSKIYFVSSTKINCSPYIVEHNTKGNTFDIDNKLVLKSCKEDYLEVQNIKNAVNKYLELDIALIKIDSMGNIYINPSEQSHATLLKVLGSDLPDDINEFSLYKGNWYIKR